MAISLSDVKKSLMGPPRLVIYGPEGVGKTTLAAQMRKPIFIASEDGLPNGIDVLTPTTYAEVIECIETLLRDDHGYQNVVLDSTTAIEPWLHDHVVATVPNEKGARMSNILQYGFNKGFDHAVKEWASLLAGFNALRSIRGMGVAMLAHVALERVENPETDPYEKFQIKLQKKAAATLCEWADAVLFINPKVVAVASGEHKSGDERKRAVGDGSATIHATFRPAWQAKNRYRLPREGLPLITNDPAATWAPIQAAIDAMTINYQPSMATA